MGKGGVWNEPIRTLTLRTTRYEYYRWVCRWAREEAHCYLVPFGSTFEERFGIMGPSPCRDDNGIAIVGTYVYVRRCEDSFEIDELDVGHLTISVQEQGLLQVEARCGDVDRFDSHTYMWALVNDSLRAFGATDAIATLLAQAGDPHVRQQWIDAGCPFCLDTTREQYLRWLSSKSWAWAPVSDWEVVQEHEKTVLLRPDCTDMVRVVEFEVWQKDIGEILIKARWVEEGAIEWRPILWVMIHKSLEKFCSERTLGRDIEGREAETSDGQARSEYTEAGAGETWGRDERQQEAETPPGPQLDNEPWRKIRQSKKREAVKLLWQRLQDPEIADKLGVASKTVSNWFSELRGLYGPEVVPTRDDLRRGSPG